MNKYIIKYFTPQGGKVAVYYADSEKEACMAAKRDGLSVTFCERS